MSSHENSQPTHSLESLLAEANHLLDRSIFPDEQAERFEQLVKVGLQECFDDLVTNGFAMTEDSLRPPGYALGKLEGYIQVLVVWGDEAAAEAVEDLISRTMVRAYKARIPPSTGT